MNHPMNFKNITFLLLLATNLLQALTLAGPIARPWRPQTSRYSSTSSRPSSPRQQGSLRASVDDSLSHFLDIEDVKHDRRTRLWTVDFKSRRPGVLSLTSRL